MATPFIIAGLAGAAVYMLSGLIKKPAAAQFRQLPLVPLPQEPAPQQVAPAVQEQNPGVLPLDEDGFARLATEQFIRDNNLQERVDGPLVQESFANRSRPAANQPVLVSAPVMVQAPLEPEVLRNQPGFEEHEEESDGFFSNIF